MTAVAWRGSLKFCDCFVLLLGATGWFEVRLKFESGDFNVGTIAEANSPTEDVGGSVFIVLLLW